MRRLRGSTLGLISVATGIIAAVAVAIAWIPIMRERDRVALDDQQQRLQFVAALAVDRAMTLAAGDRQPLFEAPARASPPDPAAVAALRQLVEPELQRISALAGVERILVFDGRSRLLAAYPPRPTAVYGDQVVDPALGACSRAPSGVWSGRSLHREGSRRRQAHCLEILGASGQAQGYGLVVADSEAVIAEARRGSRDLLVILGFASLAGLLGLAGMRRLLSPISAVAAAAGRIAAGERGVRVAAAGTEEMRQLAHAMNALASSVEGREDEIGDRLQVVQQLSRMVAHEVRNPLQSLSLLVTLARTEPDPKTRDDQLRLIEEEIHGLEGVVQRFLSQSGPLRVLPVETNLVEVLERAASLAQPRASARGVRLRVHSPARLPAVVDGTLVRRALENLLLNALEFAGTVPGRSGQVVISLLPERDMVGIIVDDDGPGVPAELRERVFEADFSAKPGGTGLGLALVRQVFDAHHGYIRCEASPMGGARFVAALPRRPSGEARA